METKRIALFTSAGPVGKRVTEEALNRGHKVTAIVRDENELNIKHPNLRVVKGDASKKDDVSRCARGHEIAIFVQETKQRGEGEHLNSARNFLNGVKEAGVKQMILSGHSIHRPTELTEEEYRNWEPFQEEQQSVLKLLEREPEAQWSYIYTPQSKIEPKTRRYTVGQSFVVANPHGENELPTESFAKTILDESEKMESIELQDL